MRRRMSYRSVSGLRVCARLDSANGLPSCMGLDRGAGSWSRQSGPAVDGTTFLELGTAEDTPRWDQGDDGVEALLLENAATNLVPYPLLADVAPANDIPDNWNKPAGTAGVDCDVVDAGAPDNGAYARLLDTAGNRGYSSAATAALAAGTGYVASEWCMRTAGAASSQYIFTDPGIDYFSLTLPEGPYDWQRLQVRGVISGAGGASNFYFYSIVDPAGVVSMARPQLEAGDCATSFVNGSRAAELLTIDPAVVGRYRGDVALKYRFDYASTAPLSVRPCLFPWANGYEVVFDPADDKVKVVVGGVDCAESAALAFARQSWHDIRVIYGASGQRLIVDGTEYDDATAWGDPGVLAPFLNSRAASANCRPGAIARFESAWL